jgi:chromosome transmission fidelity protein 18
VKPTGNLLDVPIHRLMDELFATTAQRLTCPDNDPSTSSGPCSSRTEQTLWVDRYRPKRFTDLLGDERVHREVLAWVKQWDLCVFGKGKKHARDSERFAGLEDELCRPQEKVRPLLRGKRYLLTDDGRYCCCPAPLGWGKRPLPMSLRRKQGTRSSRSMPGMSSPPEFILALRKLPSDARSGQVVDERIRPALESGYAVGSSKPVLVVIDEIDGATGDNVGSKLLVPEIAY